MLEEWAYVKLSRSNGARLNALLRWLDTYNHRRPHTALGGLPAGLAAENYVSGNYI